MTSRTRPRPARPLDRRPSAHLSWGSVEELRPALMAVLVPRCRDEHEAEDLAHEALLRAARFRRGLADPRRERAWIVQIALNLHRDHARRQSRWVPHDPDDTLWGELPAREHGPGAEPAEWIDLEGATLEKGELCGHLAAALDELVLRDRVVLRAYYGDEGSTAAAAEACGIAAGLVKVRLFRARKRLESRVRRRVAAAVA